ncbi:MAG: hypothetical protein ACN4GZ_11405 [Acidimicrobiales bacterium]
MDAPLFRTIAVFMTLAMIVASCGVDPSATGSSDDVTDPGAAAGVPADEPDAPWAEEAVVWTDALSTLPSKMGGSAFRYFWDPNIAFDYRSMWRGAQIERGEAAFSLMRGLLPPRTDASRAEGPVFISTDRVVFQTYLDWQPSGRDTTGTTATPAHLVNVLGPIGMHGAKKMVSAFASDSWRERRPSFIEPEDADSLALRWVEAWSDQTVEFTDLYDPRVLFRDTIARLRASSSDELETVRADQRSMAWSITRLEDGTPAVYPISTRSFVLDGVVMIVEGDDGAGCPGRLAVVLSVTDGKIAFEERFWDIEQARRCLEPENLPGGWWEGRDLIFDETLVSVEDLVTLTGWVQVNGARIRVYNGTDRLEAGLRWALERFDKAGLAVPNPASVTFTRHLELCDEVLGRSVLGPDGWRLYLCFHENGHCVDDACESLTIRPKHILLHELAHVWTHQNLNDDVRAELMARLGLDVWEDRDAEWSEQAREHAAETIAWGLLDRPLNLYRIGLPDEDQLRSQFFLLTGQDAIQPGSEG